jgi:hypothetical protein
VVPGGHAAEMPEVSGLNTAERRGPEGAGVGGGVGGLAD